MPRSTPADQQGRNLKWRILALALGAITMGLFYFFAYHQFSSPLRWIVLVPVEVLLISITTIICFRLDKRPRYIPLVRRPNGHWER